MVMGYGLEVIEKLQVIEKLESNNSVGANHDLPFAVFPPARIFCYMSFIYYIRRCEDIDHYCAIY